MKDKSLYLICWTLMTTLFIISGLMQAVSAGDRDFAFDGNSNCRKVDRHNNFVGSSGCPADQYCKGDNDYGYDQNSNCRRLDKDREFVGSSGFSWKEYCMGDDDWGFDDNGNCRMVDKDGDYANHGGYPREYCE